MSEPEPVETPGSSKLTEAQSEWYEDRYGDKYRYVQTQPLTLDEHGRPVARASRRERRRNKHHPRQQPS